MGLRAKLMLLVTLPAISVLLLALYTNLEYGRLEEARVRKDLMKVAQLVAAGQAGLIEATRKHLVGLARLPQARGTDLAGFDVFFGGMPKIYTDYIDFGLIETNGNLVACSFARTNVVSLFDQPHFQRVLRTRQFAVGDFQGGGNAGKPTLPFGHPVFDESGRLARVIYATLDLAVLNRVLSRTQVSENETIDIFDRGGRILASYPESGKWVGQSITESQDLSSIMDAESSVAEMNGLDGVPRAYAFTSAGKGNRDGDFFVRVGIPTSLAYVETRRILFLNLTILGVVAVVTLIFARLYADRYILHPVKALGFAAQRVAAGDLGTRTGIISSSGELNQLARSFDEMAGSLQKQRTEAELSANALRQSERRFRQLADTMPQIVWTAQPDGRVNYFNKRWYDYTGSPRDETDDETWTSNVHPDDVQACLQRWREAVESGEPFQIECRFKDGQTGIFRWHLGRALPVQNETGRIAGWFGTYTDIDDNKKASGQIREMNATLERRVAERTAQLEIMNKELEAFSYSVSHDLRAPVRHISGFTDLLTRHVDGSLDDTGRRFLGVISDSAKRMGVLIDQLLQFSRMSRKEMRHEDVNLESLVQEVVVDSQQETTGRNIVWKNHGLPVVKGDLPMLRQVLVNLVSNALKYTRPRDPAVIEIGSQTGRVDEVVIFIRDNGAGFDPAYAHKLFGVFQRLHDAAEFEGTGIGLANVQRIILRHGGRVWAEGMVNEGATFYFSLPIMKKESSYG